MIKLSIRRAGACMFDITIHGDACDLPALLSDDKVAAYFAKMSEQQTTAMAMLDDLLGKLNADVILGIFPWHTNDDVRICGMSFSALPKEGQSVVNTWVKACNGKFGKSLMVE